MGSWFCAPKGSDWAAASDGDSTGGLLNAASGAAVVWVEVWRGGLWVLWAVAWGAAPSRVEAAAATEAATCCTEAAACPTCGFMLNRMLEEAYVG